MNELMTKK